MKDDKGLLPLVAERQQTRMPDCPVEGSENQKEMKSCNFHALIVCLNYLTNKTRPDLPFGVRVSSRYNQNPRGRHWLQGNYISRYLKATKCRKLTSKQSQENRAHRFL